MTASWRETIASKSLGRDPLQAIFEFRDPTAQAFIEAMNPMFSLQEKTMDEESPKMDVINASEAPCNNCCMACLARTILSDAKFVLAR
jgi:hypothetical protein